MTALVALVMFWPVEGRARRLFDAPFYSHETGRRPNAIAVADLNRDGLPDMVTANADDHTVSVLPGRGDGTFGEHADFPTGGSTQYSYENQERVAIADLDADGALDVIATTGPHDTTFSVLYGNGDGTLGPPLLIPTSSTPSALAVADLDGDGHADIVVSVRPGFTDPPPGEGRFNVSVFLANGDRTFRPGAVLPFPGSSFVLRMFRQVELADFDENGVMDLALLHWDWHQSQIILFPGHGDGTFEPARLFDIEAGSGTWMAVTDVNSDGHSDVVATGLRPVPSHEECEEGGPCPVDTSVVSVLLGNGDGTLASPIVVYMNPLPDPNSPPDALVAGDLDGDAKPDLAIAYDVTVCCGTGNGIILLRGIGDGTFQPLGRIPPTRTPLSVAIADADLDGNLDLLAPSWSEASVHLGTGDGTFGPRDIRYEGGGRPVAVVTADFDADEWPDLASANADPWGVSVLLNRGDGTFGSRTDYRAPWQMIESLTASDFNGDGLPDVAVSGLYEGGVVVLLGTGGGALGDWSHSSLFSAAATAAADLDRDGHLDLAVAPRGGDAVLVGMGRGDGTFAWNGNGFGHVMRPVSVAIGDFDEDGNPDVACGFGWESKVAVLFGNADGTLARQVDLPVAASRVFVALGDVNHDGHLDIAASGGSDGGPSSVSILLGRGDGTFGPAVAYSTTYGSCAVAIGDLDADGHADLAVGGWIAATVLLGRGDGTFGGRIDYGLGPSSLSVAIADVNRDRRLDLVAAVEFANGLVVLRNRGPFPTRLARLDVHPGSCPNRLNSGSRGVTPMALLGDASFDVREVDRASLRLQGGILPLRTTLQDVGGAGPSNEECACPATGPDGRVDLALKFDTEAIDQRLGVSRRGDAITLTLTGTLVDGTPFEARDCVTLVGGGPRREARPLLASPASGRVQRWSLGLESPAWVELAIFDIQGRRLARPASGLLPAGDHVIEWPRAGLRSGLYFYRYSVGGIAGSGRILVLD